MQHRAPDDVTWIVGRAAELDELDACARSSMGGEPRCVLVQGAAGIGRTTLLRKFCIQEPTATVWWAGGDQTEADLPYGMVSQLYRYVAPAGDQPHPWSDRVPANLPAAEVGGHLLRAIETTQRLRPLIVVLDDAQWLDEPSLGALGYMLRRLHHGRVMLICSLRASDRAPADLTTEVEDRLRRLMSDQVGATDIRLPGLSAEDVCALAEHLELPIEMSVATRLCEYLGGNPRYVLDSLRRLTSPGARGRLPLPSAVLNNVRRMINRQPAESRRLLAALAVLDGRHPLSTVADVAGVTDAPRHLAPLLAQGFVLWWPEDPGTPITIDTQLHRDAIYRSMEPHVRQELHGAVADRVDRFASLEHRVAASTGLDDDLADELEAASADVARLGEGDRAAALLLWAADVTSDRSRHERRLLSAAAQLTWYRRWDRLAELRTRIEACAPSPLRSLALGSLAHSNGQLSLAEARLSETLTMAGTDTELRPLVVRAWLSLTWSCGWRDQGHLEGVLARWVLAEPNLDTQNRYWAAYHAADAEGRLTDGPHRALETLRKLAPIPTPSTELDPNDAVLLGMHGSLLARAGRLTESIRTLTALEQYTHIEPVQDLISATRAELAFAYHLTGAWEQAMATAEEAVAAAERTDSVWTRSFVYGAAACVHAPAGQLARAGELMRTARRWWRPANSQSEVSYPALAAATIAQAHADHPAMLAALQPVLDLPAASGHVKYFQLWLRPLQVEALIGAGNLPEALQALHRMTELTGKLPALEITVGWLGGWLAERQGDYEEARAKYESALALPATVDDLPFCRARLAHAYGRLLLGRGSRRAAIGQLRQAFERYSLLGAQPFLEQCAADLAASGLRVSTGQDIGPLAVLSAKEHRVAHLVAAGLTNQQVAREIYISVKTVEFHLGNIFAKLGINSRKDLAVLVSDQAETQGGTRLSIDEASA